jgi:hypothetical protein
MKSKIKFFKRTDIIILAAIIAAGLTGFSFWKACASDRPAAAEIYYCSELVETVDLNTGEERIFTIPQNENVVFHLYPDGGICFEKSDCPDQVCVHSGKLYTVGESAACLPNGIILKIVPKQKGDWDDMDIVVGK